MQTLLKLYGIALASFILIDGFWLGLVAKNFYAEHLGFLMKSNINWLAAITFYLLFIVGLVVFVIAPNIEKQSILPVILMGGLFGLITYATYDLTNLATLKNWPIIVTIIDMIWGTTLGATVSGLTYFIFKRFGL